MAHKRKCPYCDEMTDNQKKGTSGGKQRFKCNKCNRQWTEGVTSNNVSKSTPKSAPKKKSVTTRPGKTVIIVNNNTIRSDIKGKISKQDALEIAGEYFKEIQKEKVEVKEVGDTLTYTFKISNGRKG